jgi:two-component system, OmpR family, heavy metal sensor histidine kinase CusS
MNRLSIRWRLTLWYGAVLAAVLAVFGASVYLMMRHALLARTGAGMSMESTEVAEEVARSRDGSTLGTWLERRFARHPGYDIQVSTAGGEPLFRSERIKESGLPRPSDPPATGRPTFESFAGWSGHAHLLSRIVPGPDGSLLLQIAAPLAADDDELGELPTVMLLAGPLALALALGGGYLLARRALAPVDRMAAEADQITATRLDRRLEVPNPGDELGRLGATLNGMITRLERSFEETRRFTADAAHELRTPLAVMRNVAEVALRLPREPEHYRRVLGDVLEEVERLTRLAEQLLFLCREDAGLVPMVMKGVRLDEVVRDAAEHMSVVAGAKGLTLEGGDLASCPIRADADQIRRLLFNLLDTAIKFTPAGGTVRVSLERSDGRARLAIADTGVGIPAEHIPHVFERFYRVDPSRGQDIEGTGLGLAICRSIAEAHGGEIRIESEVGQWTRAILTLPVQPEAGESWRYGTIAGEEGRPAPLTNGDAIP